MAPRRRFAAALRYTGLLLIAGLLASSCHGGQLGGGAAAACETRDDCRDPYVCEFGRCRGPCERDSDCTQGTCVRAASDPDAWICLPKSCKVDAGDRTCHARDAAVSDAGDASAQRANDGGDASTDDAGDGAAPRDANVDIVTDHGGKTPGDAAVDEAPRPASMAVSYQIDTEHTGGQSADEFAPPLEQKWSVDLGGSVSYPLIADGRIFVSVVLGGGAALYALDARDGSVLWGPKQLGTIWATAAYDAGRVFALNENGTVAAFDATSGKRIWNVQLDGRLYGSPPIASHGVLLIGNGNMVVLDAESGASLWLSNAGIDPPDFGAAAIDAPLCLRVFASVRAPDDPRGNYAGACFGGIGAAIEDRVYVLDRIGTSLVFDEATGAKIGAFSATQIPTFDHAGRGFFVMDNVLHASAILSETELWTFTSDYALRPAVTANGYVYAATFLGTLYALEAESGEVADMVQLPEYSDDPGGNASPFSGLAIGGGLLVVPSGSWLAAY